MSIEPNQGISVLQGGEDVKTTEAEKVMRRCQIGARNYNEANDLHAECYGTIGALAQERGMLRIEARQQKHRADVLAAAMNGEGLRRDC